MNGRGGLVSACRRGLNQVAFPPIAVVRKSVEVVIMKCRESDTVVFGRAPAYRGVCHAICGTRGAGLAEAPWRFSAKGYGWLPEAPVDIYIDQQEVANLPESLDNILDDLDLAAMFELEAHKGKLGFFISPIYYEGKDTEHFEVLPGERRKFTMEESVWVVDYGVSYEIGQWRLGRLPIPPR